MGGAVMSRPSHRDGLAPGEPIPEREEQDVNAALQTYAVGLLWAFGFEAIHRAVPIVCKNMSWWKGLPDSQAKYEARAYITSLFHHFVAVPFSVWSLWRDAANVNTLDLDYSGIHRKMLSFSVGFFLADTWFARAHLLKSWDYSIHHLFALALTWKAAGLRGGTRFLSHFLVSEITTIFLDMLWFLRKLKAEDSRAFKIIGAIFTALYAVVRVYWLPYMTWSLYADHPRAWKGLGAVAWTTVGVSALQVWWFYRIVAKFAPLLMQLFGRPSKAAAAAAATASSVPMA